MADNAKRATMRQVAERAGVSAMTVSKALGGKPGVSEETRKRILAIASELRYTPNMLATSFRTNHTNTIGIVMSPNLEEVFAMLFRGMEAAASELGFSTLVATSGEELPRMEEVVRLLVGRRVDGLLLTSPQLFTDKERRIIEKTGVPYVLAVRSCDDTSVSSVVNNNYMGGYGMVDYLAGSGSRRFLLLALTRQRCSSQERLRGWLDALRDHGLKAEPELVEYAEPTVESGRELMRRHLGRKRLKFDTVVCGSDLIALGAMTALLEAGVSIPGQVRVSGYDGIPLSAHLRIPLTTVQQPLYEIGRTGMQLLAEKIRNPTAPAQQVTINGKLVIREST